MQITQLFSFYKSPYELEENQHNLIHRNISQHLHKEDKSEGSRSKRILPVEQHVKYAKMDTGSHVWEMDGNPNLCMPENSNSLRRDGFILLLY